MTRVDKPKPAPARAAKVSTTPLASVPADKTALDVIPGAVHGLSGIQLGLFASFIYSPVTTGNPLTWTVADVGRWLHSIEMDNYIDSFAKNKIDGQCLKHMDDETLRALGVSLSVHRTKLLQQVIQTFGSGQWFACLLYHQLTHFLFQMEPLAHRRGMCVVLCFVLIFLIVFSHRY